MEVQVDSQPKLEAAQRQIWIRVAWCAALLVILYADVIAGMTNDWRTDEDMGHGFFVPLVVCYIVWNDRERLLRIQPKPHWLGYVFIVLGFLQLMVGFFAAEFFVQRTALIVTTVGVLVALGGMPLLKPLLFPLFLLLFMIRIPAIVYAQITLPLQLLASQIAEHALQLMGIPVFREGNVLELASQRLSVVEACSGIRSLLSLSFLSLVYGYFFEGRRWVRCVLFLSTVPIAVGANALRVTLTGVLSEWNKEYAQGLFHTLEGWVLFMLALTGLVAIHGLMRKFSPRRSAA